MIELRRFSALGRTSKDALRSRHHLCFAAYQRTDRMAWGRLRVLNHNILAPGGEVPDRPQDNMEVLQWTRKGILGHSGTLGDRHRTLPGSLELVSSGRGILMGELNPGNHPVEYFDIWIRADRRGGSPSRCSLRFPLRADKRGFTILASGFPEDRDCAPLRAKARVLGANAAAGVSLSYSLGAERHGYLLVARGLVEIGGRNVAAGDGAVIAGEEVIDIKTARESEVILIDA